MDIIIFYPKLKVPENVDKSECFRLFVKEVFGGRVFLFKSEGLQELSNIDVVFNDDVPLFPYQPSAEELGWVKKIFPNHEALVVLSHV